MRGSFFRAVTLFVILLALWMLMSGIYKPLLIGFGVASCALCTWIAHRLEIKDSEGVPTSIDIIGMIRYSFWLVVEIGRADWAVTKVILDPAMNVRQRLLKVPVSQKSDLGRVVFANSITITPGTITVETEKDYFIVHALTDEAADSEALADMDRRVSKVESRGPNPYSPEAA